MTITRDLIEAKSTIEIYTRHDVSNLHMIVILSAAKDLNCR